MTQHNARRRRRCCIAKRLRARASDVITDDPTTCKTRITRSPRTPGSTLRGASRAHRVHSTQFERVHP
eukprot:745505-Pleurochrysis_carterae.AAC.1